MQGLRTQRWASWIGIVLVLMNLLAPTVSHAVRATHGVAATPTEALAWCSPLAGLQPSSPSDDAEADGTGSTLGASLHACGYCVTTALSPALTTPLASPIQAPPGVSALAAWPTAAPLRASVPWRHRSRAPPLPS
jgi:hypothetical protein